MPYTYKYPRPAVTVDCVIFGKSEHGMHVLLIQRKNPPYQNHWALPGGFLYPATKSYPATTGTRIGFSVEDVDTTIASIRQASAQILTEPADSPWGRRAVVIDPDGHKVELTTHPAEQ